MRMRDNTRTLYRVTSADAARKIAKSGMMLRGSPACMFGSGIYFAETPDIAAGKAFLPALGAGASTSAMGHINAIMASAPTRETARRSNCKTGVVTTHSDNTQWQHTALCPSRRLAPQARTYNPAFGHRVEPHTVAALGPHTDTKAALCPGRIWPDSGGGPLND